MELDRADLIYHESQQAALCGLHAVNTLLQAPHFTEVEMAAIAHELDAAERELMASAGVESAEFLNYMAEESGNVAENGMFSIQVLSRALEVFELQAVPLTSPDAADAQKDPTTQEAFICNLQEHWFTVRKIHDQWWNLNSVYSSPEPLSAFHLAAYLGSLQEEGYTIFVIEGALPPSQPPASEVERFVPGVSGRWFTPEEARAATQEREQLKNQGFAKAIASSVLEKAAGGQGTWVTLGRPGGKRRLEGSVQQGDDPELAQALAASLADHPGSSRGGGAGAWGGGGRLGGAAAAVAASDEDADLAAAIAASLADRAAPEQSQQQPQQHTPADLPAGSGDDHDADLAAAIAASLQPAAVAQESAGAGTSKQQEQQAGQQPAEEAQEEEVAAPSAPLLPLPELQAEPEAGAEGSIEVALRLPNGSRASRRFDRGSDTVGHLAAYAAQQGTDVAACQLAVQFPRRVFADWEQTLADAGIGHKELIILEPK